MKRSILVLCFEGFVGIVSLEVEPVAGGLLEIILGEKQHTCVRVG